MELSSFLILYIYNNNDDDDDDDDTMNRESSGEVLVHSTCVGSGEWARYKCSEHTSVWWRYTATASIEEKRNSFNVVYYYRTNAPQLGVSHRKVKELIQGVGSTKKLSSSSGVR